jgi:hypothetical protein
MKEMMDSSRSVGIRKFGDSVLTESEKEVDAVFLIETTKK